MLNIGTVVRDDAVSLEKNSTSNQLTVSFWGTRGSFPQSGHKFVEFGGHTSCVSIEGPDTMFILDGGSGMLNLGNAMVRAQVKSAHIFLSHLHLDHICGLPAFKPIWQKDFSAHIYCGTAQEFGGIEKALGNILKPPYFPVDWSDFTSQRTHHDYMPGETLAPTENAQIQTIELNHPGGGTGYRFELYGKSIVFLCDTNHTDGAFDRYLPFAKDADLIIYDATFTDAEHEKYSFYGHSTWRMACELAKGAGAKALALYHHDPDHTDEILHQIEADARKIFPGAFAARCDQKVQV